MLRRLMTAAALFVGAGATPGQEVRIQQPANDTIVMAPQVTVEGTGPGGAEIRLRVGDRTHTARADAAGAWQIANVAVPSGMNVWTATSGASSHSVLITKGENISQRPRQRVRFVWEDGVDDELVAIANGTLTVPLNETTRVGFVQGVRTETEVAFSRAYRDFDVEIVSVDGDDVHTVRMMTNSGGIFGQSPPDCGNRTLKQESEVWVGTYRASMVDRFNEWGPMRKADTWQVRMIDVAEALGRTSAHEAGHSLGMVGSGSGTRCGWMRGCDGGHNCDQVDVDFPLANRFDSGFFIMDPGPKTENNARLAEPSRAERAATRVPAVFNTFNRSYLGIIHPNP